MSADILVLVEHEIQGEWVLVDVDPLISAERTSGRLRAIEALANKLPTNLSKGVQYWLGSDGAPRFIAVLPLLEAVSVWHQTEVDPRLKSVDPKNVRSLALSYFACWDFEPDKWRVVVTCR